jgi:hypothetical protein
MPLTVGPAPFPLPRRLASGPSVRHHRGVALMAVSDSRVRLRR